VRGILFQHTDDARAAALALVDDQPIDEPHGWHADVAVGLAGFE